jgi:Protein ChrB, N-terminal
MPQKWKPATWLVFIYRVPSEPARKRTFVWRRLTQLGALYVQQAACLLPDTEVHAAELEKLAARVREFEGEATLLHAASMNADWEKDIMRRFNADRSAQYAKLREEIDKFVAEIDLEEHRQRFTLGEVEELEARFDGLQRWFDKVKQRDFFKLNGALEIHTALQAAGDRLEAFAARVEQVEGMPQRPLKRRRAA